MIKLLKKKKIFTITNKPKEKGLHSTSRKYNIDRKPLRRWVNNIEKLKKIVNKKRRQNLNGGGRKPYTIDIEEQLIEFKKNIEK